MDFRQKSVPHAQNPLNGERNGREIGIKLNIALRDVREVEL